MYKSFFFTSMQVEMKHFLCHLGRKKHPYIHNMKKSQTNNKITHD